jgi:nitroreductase
MVRRTGPMALPRRIDQEHGEGTQPSFWGWVAMPTISRAIFEDAVAAGVRAPSMYNSQPWRFRLHRDRIEIRLDPSRHLPASDPDSWGARIAVGAAACNVQLALAANGLVATQRIVSLHGRGIDVVVTGSHPPAPRDLELCHAIGSRVSHRHPFGSQPVPAPARARIADAATDARTWIELLDERAPIARVAEILNCADFTLRNEPAYADELARWVGVAEEASEGIPILAAGVHPEAQDLLPMRDYGGRPRGPGRDFETDPLIAVIGTVGAEAYDDLIAGAALQRVLLTATAAGLASSMLSQAMEVPSARIELRDALGHFGMPQMVIRLGYGDPAMPSPRRPIADVIDF